MQLIEKVNVFTQRNKKFLVLLLIFLLTALYLSFMPSIFDVGTLVIKAVANPNGIHGYILNPVGVRHLDQQTITNGIVLGRDGYSFIIPDSPELKDLSEEGKGVVAYQIGKGKNVVLGAPSSTASFKEFYRRIDGQFLDTYGTGIEKAFGVELDTEYQCLDFCYGIWAGSFSPINDQKNRMVLDLLAYNLSVRGHGKIYRIDTDFSKGFLDVFQYPAGDINAKYTFFRNNNLDSATEIQFRGLYTIEEMEEIIRTIRFEEE